MKPNIKVGSFLLAIVMMFSVFAIAGCTPTTLNKEWSYKTSDNELAIGVYIYSLNAAYSQAESFAKKLDDYDSTSDKWLDEKIKDDDGNEQVAREWIKDQAKKMCLSYLVVDEQLKKQVIQDVTLLKLVGFKPIIVHGGGKEISKWVGKVGMEPVFVNGLRKTDADTMEIAEMVLNKVNKSLVTLVEELGVQAVGVSGKDGGLLKVKKKYSNGEDIGFVGEITDVNPKILYDLLEKDFLPIVCPIGLDDEYNTYNINADDAACAIARAVSAEKLAFLTDIEGVYKDPSDKNTLISELTVSDAKKLIGDGFIGGGMLPKLNNCIDAIDNGVSRVHILDGRIAHCLLLEIFTNRGIGTAILGDSEEKFNNEQ